MATFAVTTARATSALAAERAASQIGLPRGSDPGKYPLSTRVFGAGPACGHVMYGVTKGTRKVYCCSRYRRTDGGECHYNHVDAEAALSLTLDVLRQRTVLAGGREALKRRLTELAAAEAAGRRLAAPGEADRLRKRLGQLERERDQIGRNLARATDATYTVIEREYGEAAAAVQAVQAELAAAEARTATVPDTAAEVEAALALFDDLSAVLADPAARERIRPLLDRIGFRMDLEFTEGRKGTRPVRVLKGGTITFGQAAIATDGLDDGQDDEDDDERNDGHDDGEGPHTPAPNPSQLSDACDASDGNHHRPVEGVSFTKGTLECSSAAPHAHKK